MLYNHLYQTLLQYPGRKIYVNSVVGSDANPGTDEEPLATIQEAIDNHVRNGRGDQVIATGTFAENLLIDKDFVALHGYYKFVTSTLPAITVDKGNGSGDPIARVLVAGAFIRHGANAKVAIYTQDAAGCVILSNTIVIIANDTYGGIGLCPTGGATKNCGDNMIVGNKLLGNDKSGSNNWGIWVYDDGYPFNLVIGNVLGKFGGTGSGGFAVLNALSPSHAHHVCLNNVFWGNFLDVAEATPGHHWFLRENIFIDNPSSVVDGVNDGFGDIKPYPSAGFTNPDHYPLATSPGIYSRLGTPVDALAKKIFFVNGSGDIEPPIDKGIWDAFGDGSELSKEATVAKKEHLVHGTGDITPPDNIGLWDVLDAIYALAQAMSGTGDVAVDHNYGGTDAMRVMSSGVPIDNATIRVYTKADYDAGNLGYDFIRGETRSREDGRWRRAIYLDAEITYTIVVFKTDQFQAETTEVSVT